MPVTQHSIIVPSANNAPNPSGTLQFPEQPGPSPDNLLQCSYPCTVDGHESHLIHLFFCHEQGFSLGAMPSYFKPDDTVSFTYDPPLV